MRRRDTRGQTTVLVVGLAVIVIGLVAVVVDASAAYLQRQSLSAIADGAALAAADGVQGEQVYTSGRAERAAIDPGGAAAHAADYLATVGAPGAHPGLVHEVRVQGPRVVVWVSAPADLPFAVPGVAGSRVSVTAAAIVVVPE